MIYGFERGVAQGNAKAMRYFVETAAGNATASIASVGLSGFNTRPEIEEEIAHHFEAGTQGGLDCDQDGTLKLYFFTPPEVRPASEICSKFPSVIGFSDG